MELKVQIKTPPGQAKDFTTQKHMKLLKKIMLRKSKIIEQYVGDNDSTIYWVVEVSAKNYQAVIKNLMMYNTIVKTFFSVKTVKQLIRKLADSEEDYQTVKKMIESGTEIEIIKKATAEEMIDVNTTWWDRVKKTFKRKKVEED